MWQDEVPAMMASRLLKGGIWERQKSAGTLAPSIPVYVWGNKHTNTCNVHEVRNEIIIGGKMKMLLCLES